MPTARHTYADAVRHGADLRELLRERWFPRLFGTRLVSQAADGVLQASLASAVFFNPDHQTDPKQAAAGFVVLLLPYSLVGPFAGVFLDRWRRQRVLVRANLVRPVLVVSTALLLLTTGPHGIPFYASALAALSVNRFYLSALSASLPHVVRPHQLLLANSVTTTAGTFVTILGMGAGLAIRKAAGSGDHGSAVIALSSCVVYVAASHVARRMPQQLLGPDEKVTVELRHALRAVVVGLAAGARDVWVHRSAARALLAMGGSRLLTGMATIGTLLLYRNYFHDQGPLRAGLVGLSQAFAASAVGYVAAAVATPLVTARVEKSRWIVRVFVGAAVVELACGLPFMLAPLLIGAALLGFATQSAKICVDTIVQEEIEDTFRGRVFSFYDTLFNLTFVVAAVLGAFVLPTNGKSYAVVGALGAGYALIAAVYAAAERPHIGGVTAPKALGAQT
jgi:MFS family permease